MHHITFYEEVLVFPTFIEGFFIVINRCECTAKMHLINGIFNLKSPKWFSRLNLYGQFQELKFSYELLDFNLGNAYLATVLELFGFKIS